MPYEEGAKEKDQSITDPCFKERQLSLRCMDKHDYDKDSCAREFENFKNCKSFWTDIIKHRRRDNILPEIPPVEERDAIRREKFKI